jgi:hypothetical protein
VFTAAGCQLLFLRTADAHARLHRQTRVRCGPVPWMCLLQKARCVRAGTTTTRQLHPIHDHRWHDALGPRSADCLIASRDRDDRPLCASPRS